MVPDPLAIGDVAPDICMPEGPGGGIPEDEAEKTGEQSPGTRGAEGRGQAIREFRALLLLIVVGFLFHDVRAGGKCGAHERTKFIVKCLRRKRSGKRKNGGAVPVVET